MWRWITSANAMPLDQDLAVAVIDQDGVHSKRRAVDGRDAGWMPKLVACSMCSRRTGASGPKLSASIVQSASEIARYEISLVASERILGRRIGPKVSVSFLHGSVSLCPRGTSTDAKRQKWLKGRDVKKIPLLGGTTTS